jgi:uncharacterized membrane-anchored protein YitT (DUF2179 family)
MAYFMMGKEFAIKTIFGIILLSICVAYVSFPDVTKDNLLVAIFGGFF